MIRCEMAATVWKVRVGVGTVVAPGDEIVVLESMKMEIPVLAATAGMVAVVHVSEGSVIAPGDVLVEISPS